MGRYLKPVLAASVLALVSTGAIASETKVERKPLVGQEFGYEPTAPLPVDEGAGIYVRRFGVETEDGSERFRLRGRVQFDVAMADWGDDMHEVARQGHELSEYGMIFRRLRLGALGIMRERFEWQLEVDFAENEVDLANAYMAYLMDHGGRLAFGYFKEPFGMEYATSSRYITFMERSLPSDAYKVNREPGIMYETIQPNWYLGAGFFGGGIDFDREVEEGYAFSLRTSFAPYLSNGDYVHLGAGVNHRINGEDLGLEEYLPVRLRAREGTRVMDVRLIGRDDIEGVKHFTRSNLEFAAGRGSWWTQAEYYRVDLKLDPDKGDVRTDDTSLTLDGWYIYTGYFLTGEKKPYRAFSGDYGQLRPNANFSPANGTWGAFEVALGYSKADSEEHSRPGRGQKGERWVLGLNWYLTPEVLTRFNVIYQEGERDGVEDDAWIFGARFQYIF